MHEMKTNKKEMEGGKSLIKKEGKEVAVLRTGHPGNFVKEAFAELENEGIQPAHFHFPYVKPLDEGLLHEVFKNFSRIVTVEDGTVMGGFGSAVVEFMSDHGYSARVKRLGVPDKFIEQGKNEELHHECGYDTAGIIKTVKALL